MKTELSFIPNIHQMENAMAKERADFIEKQSDKIALRAIDRNGLMVGREFDDHKSAVDMARDYWIKGFFVRGSVQHGRQKVCTALSRGKDVLKYEQT